MQACDALNVQVVPAAAGGQQWAAAQLHEEHWIVEVMGVAESRLATYVTSRSGNVNCRNETTATVV